MLQYSINHKKKYAVYVQTADNKSDINIYFR